KEKDWPPGDTVGEAVEADLQSQDVRLTMGGEPTFVSIDDFEAAEWNIDASGPTKPIISEQLRLRLRDRFGAGGMLHYGQGKWYPGEPLPRWALGLYWRADGLPVWRGNPPQRITPRAGTDDLAFLQRLAARLDVNPAHIL